MTDFPRVFRVRQHFDPSRLDDIPAAVRSELRRSRLSQRIGPAQSVAIAVGSRGIANLPIIVREVVAFCQSLQAQPFIVPAMGSHGGATAEGQAAVLARYGIDEQTMGCPVRSQMDVVELCQSPDGFPVYFDAVAAAADHIIVCNRVKPHTRFAGPIESGLMKMMLIGLGKHAGALVYHRAIHNFTFDHIVRSVGREVLARRPIALGMAIVENAYDETALVEAVEPEQFEQREPELLSEARRRMPRLPFEAAELLIVDRIGKDISGAGMDTNVVGRKFSDHLPGPTEWPKIGHIYVRGLSAATKGNATGIGIAEFCHARCIEQMDHQATRVNCLTGGHATAAMIPLHFSTDRESLAAAASQAGLVPTPEARWMWVPDTLHLAEVICSEAYWEEAAGREDLTAMDEPHQLRFDEHGQLDEAFAQEPVAAPAGRA